MKPELSMPAASENVMFLGAVGQITSVLGAILILSILSSPLFAPFAEKDFSAESVEPFYVLCAGIFYTLSGTFAVWYSDHLKVNRTQAR